MNSLGWFSRLTTRITREFAGFGSDVGCTEKIAVWEFRLLQVREEMTGLNVRDEVVS